MIVTCHHCGASGVQTWWLDSPAANATLRYWPHSRPHGPGGCAESNKPVAVTREIQGLLMQPPGAAESDRQRLLAAMGFGRQAEPKGVDRAD